MLKDKFDVDRALLLLIFTIYVRNQNFVVGPLNLCDQSH
jgi:hypothetical protein